ncbi:ERF family protein [Sphingomonas sp. MMS24-JH45]
MGGVPGPDHRARPVGRPVPGEMVDNRVTMTTQLSHESAASGCRGTLDPLSKVDAQGYGSAVTYARRYALAAVVRGG